MAEIADAVEGVSLEDDHAHNEGDHDSGVDETTQSQETHQGNDLKKSNSKASLPGGKRTPTSPAKSPGAGADPAQSKFNATSLTGSWSSNHSPTSPSKQKKVPMNKVQVGFAPSPNLKAVRSKIGSLENANYKPGGGQVKIETKKIHVEAKPRIAARNETYQPGGGEKKIQSQKLQWNAKSKIGSLENATHKPGGGDKKIETQKLDFKEKAKPKVGSTSNIKHAPGGGNVKGSSAPTTPVTESRQFSPGQETDPEQQQQQQQTPDEEEPRQPEDLASPEDTAQEEKEENGETSDDQQPQMNEESPDLPEAAVHSSELEDIPENPAESSAAAETQA